jgi:uncharacterized lipoprotein YajG
VRILLVVLLAVFAFAGCSSPPEKRIIPRSELEGMTAVEQEPGQGK